jgi:hypothetical protein
MPHSVLVLLLGQTTLLAASATIWAISLLEKRPTVAGVLFGLVAGVKPQSVLLAPLVFVRLGDWRCAGGAAVSFVSLCVASLIFGAGLWPSWIATLGTHPQMVSHYHLEIIGATPRMAAIGLHLDARAIAVFQLLGIVAGISILWVGFGSPNALVRLQCFAIGCLLASPYAMRYELAMLAPVLATAMIKAEPRSILVALPAYAFDAVSVVGSMIVSSVTSLVDQHLGSRTAANSEGAGTVPHMLDSRASPE